jgi:HAD superfamily hydrolase (TIGR01549 family)
MSVGRLFDHLGISKHRAPKILYQATRMLKGNIGNLPLIPGIAEVLPTLRNRVEHFGILTSNSVDNVQLFLQAHGLEDVFTFVSSTSKLTGKARHLRSIQKTYSIDSERMVYIGDEIRDIRAAKKAEVSVAAVGWGFNSSEALEAEEPDFLLQHPDELFSLLV